MHNDNEARIELIFRISGENALPFPPKVQTSTEESKRGKQQLSSPHLEGK